ncbi:MAG: hypothetical protein NTV52_33625 [Acidobacteria bacterium]|nr:hypothetical protein [Acidobacteriota bacterium]
MRVDIVDEGRFVKAVTELEAIDLVSEGFAERHPKNKRKLVLVDRVVEAVENQQPTTAGSSRATYKVGPTWMMKRATPSGGFVRWRDDAAMSDPDDGSRRDEWSKNGERMTNRSSPSQRRIRQAIQFLSDRETRIAA